jgi:hypothetical protein
MLKMLVHFRFELAVMPPVSPLLQPDSRLVERHLMLLVQTVAMEVRRGEQETRSHHDQRIDSLT